jgi:hypothetical protein
MGLAPNVNIVGIPAEPNDSKAVNIADLAGNYDRVQMLSDAKISLKLVARLLLLS